MGVVRWCSGRNAGWRLWVSFPAPDSESDGSSMFIMMKMRRRQCLSSWKRCSTARPMWMCCRRFIYMIPTANIRKGCWRYTMAEYYTYIVECADETLYTGYAADLAERIRTHNSGAGAKYTRNRLPVTLRYYEKFGTKSEAMKREYAIKKLTRTAKRALIESGG